MLSGRTRQGKLVHFAPPAGGRLEPGTFATVRHRAPAPPTTSPAFSFRVEAVPSRWTRERIPVVAG